MSLYPETTALGLPFKQKITQVLKIWGVAILCTIPAAIIIAVASLIIKSNYHVNIFKTNQIKESITTPFIKFISVPIILPLFEETVCRLWQNYKVKNILIALLSLAAIISFKIFPVQDLLIKRLLEISLAVLIIWLVINKRLDHHSLKLPLNIKKLIFYLVAVIFGLMHIFNYSPIYPNLWYIYPVFVLPEIILGFAFGYIRIKYGFFYGFLLHFLVNLVFVLFSSLN